LIYIDYCNDLEGVSEMLNSLVRYATNVSQAFWYTLDRSKIDFTPAEIAIGLGKSESIAWFDELFDGGILLPGERGKPLSFLITGPPGSCKTTLALELCYRLTAAQLFSLYISTEADSDQLIANAHSFGYEDVADRFIRFKKRDLDNVAVAIWGKEDIKEWKTLSEIVETAIDGLKNFLIGNAKIPQFISNLQGRLKTAPARKQIEKFIPHILVIDSLNIVGAAEREAFFQEFLTIASKGTKLVIFILDSGSSDADHKFWEYVCDIVVRLDYTTVQDYYFRTIEIVKARYQSHVWGKHQLKVYPKFPQRVPSHDEKDIEKLRRAHPFRKEGGIFIYPSIHYYLSQYKRLGHEQRPQPSDTYPPELNKILGLREETGGEGGIPEGRCTAFIGRRGGHKSHLGFLHLLHRIFNRKEIGLVVSLRDDEEMTRMTMENILRQEFPQRTRTIKDIEESNQLEILYYHPGYITPEEFFHRMFISVHRLKRTGKRLTVVFNSLDQLSARFPLCAKQQIFVPGMIEALSGERATSIFIGVDEPGQPVEQYGLLPMADLILSFNPFRFTFGDYYNHLEAAGRFVDMDKEYQAKITRIKDLSGNNDREEIVLQVIRSAGGQRAGARGLMELVDRDKLEVSLYQSHGLHFTELSAKFSNGKPIPAL
jgi:KaiC/GvpD/RAD55 family RecA-like ATPase